MPDEDAALQATLPGGRAEADEALVAQAAAAARPDAEGSAGAGAAEVFPRPEWRIAPIRWGGSLAAEWRSSSFGDAAKRRQTMETLNLRAASYIWQPWFAQVTGALALTASQSQSGGTDEFGEAATFGSGSRGVTGSFGTAIFPQSRFPFSADYTVADSRTSDVFTAVDSRTQRLSLRQSYRNVEGNEQYNATFDRSTLSSGSFGTDTVDALRLSYNRRFEEHQFDASALRTQNSRSSDDGGSNSTRLSATHLYRPDEYLQVASTLSESMMNLRTGAGASRFNSRLGFRQLSSMATWNPDTETPVLVTGAFRWADTTASTQGVDGDGASNASRSITATGTATWRPSTRLNIGASGTLTQFSSGGLSQTLTTESLSAGYVFDPKQFAGFTYLPALTANVSHQGGGTVGNRFQSGGGFTHTLVKSIPWTDRTTLGTSLSQAASLRSDSQTGASQSLTHNASLTLRHMAENGMAGYAGLSLGDGRNSGAMESRFRMVNLQVSGQIPFNRYSSASANLTVQKTKQEARLDPLPVDPLDPQQQGQQPVLTLDQGWRTNTSGGATYQHARLFGVPRLRYTANITFYNAQVNARLVGDLNAPRENVAWTHEQRLDYAIGRIDVRLSFRLAEVDGKKNALLFLRVSRGFGAF